jgi:lysine 2,3-aminomutase
MKTILVGRPDGRPSLHPKRALKDDLAKLREASPKMFLLIAQSRDQEDARRRLYRYLNGRQRALELGYKNFYALERANMRECLAVFRNVLSKRNEKMTGISTLSFLFHLIQDDNPDMIDQVTDGFVQEIVHLFRGIAGRSGIYERMRRPSFLDKHGRSAAQARSDHLDRLCRSMDRFTVRYRSGLEMDLIDKRRESRRRILKYFGGRAGDWADWRWHLGHVIRDEKTLGSLVRLTEDESRQIARARASKIPFGITPFYLSLMDVDAGRRYDAAIRAQVIPPESYVDWMVKHKEDRVVSADFMGERDTSPIDLVTRRYPQILILKPYNACPQICVYCQRNWEIHQSTETRVRASKGALQKALNWIREHPTIKEVLITGGDPLVLSDGQLAALLDQLCDIDHVERIRFGTRLLVTIPQRFTPDLVRLLARYQRLAKREMVVVTHIEHISEVTPEMAQAVARIRKKGIPVYNQLVFTTYNSRRFESVVLRRQLRLIGVEPYYTFVTKGKQETEMYRTPIARLLQEKREEARLFSGMVRADHAVFNVPRLGKTYLIAGQDHEVIMVTPDGRRIYEFFPWERKITPVDSYLYTDVPIMNFLRRLEEMGEDLRNYQTIWYYF